MTKEEKDALHADVIANTAHKIEKVSKELSNLYRDSFINNERIELRKKHLLQYFNELNNLMQEMI